MPAKDVDIREDRLSSSVVSSGGLHLVTEDTNSVLPIPSDAYLYLCPMGALGAANVLETTHSDRFGMKGKPSRDDHVCGGVLISPPFWCSKEDSTRSVLETVDAIG